MEDSEVLPAGDVPDFSPEFKSPATLDEEEESIALFIQEERISSPALLDSSSRSQSVEWILKVREFYGFEAVTAYLAVNYLDRFLGSHHLPQTGGWPLQLLSVACLSLAAKLQEPLVPSLLDLQVEGAKFIFEPKTIQRMELLVLSILDWRLQFVTPFNFLSFFACKLDVTRTYTRLLISRSTGIILSNIAEACFLEYWPSSIAVAAILCAASEMPNLSFVTPEHAQSWSDGLCKDKIRDCYKLMHKFMVDHRRQKPIKVIPQFRVTAQIPKIRSTGDSSSSSSFTSSPSPSPHNNKRRKLNNYTWVDDDHY